MRAMQLRHAQAALSTVVGRRAVDHHAARRPEAVVIGFDDWQRLSNVPSFGQLLMSAPPAPGDLPERDRSPLRDIEPA